VNASNVRPANVREFATAAEPDLTSLQAEPHAWELVYNTIPPHMALGYLTPAEYPASVGVEV
jgi:transposase InsO family protein